MSTRTVSDLGERALIDRIIARLATPSWVVVGPGDDAAVVAPKRGTLDVLTTDIQIESVHFDCRFTPPEAIGHRALAVNLSDLAAMGAEPRLALLSLALPDAMEVTTLDGVIDGLLALARAHRVALVGGNISRSPGPLTIDVTAGGTVHPRRVLTRAGARPGDEVYVTGTIGDAMAGLESLRAGAGCERCEQRYLRPEPRVRAGLLLGRNRAASACIDLSDGLADGVRRMAEASHVGVELDAAALPLAEDVRQWHEARGHDALDAAVRGGDDYELLFTVRPAHGGRLKAVRRQIGHLPISKVGIVTKDPGLSIRTPDGVRPLPEGFAHFR
ncbi:MAG: thiamine-phosphate kinase [Acidobacteria bacterium]|nr:thiamine-phosphate kinase [Acidobacteriota bacterium]